MHDEYIMPNSYSDPTSDAPPKKRRFRPRYSLRSLMLFMLLFSASLALREGWSPWQEERVLRVHGVKVDSAAFSPDGRRIVTGHSRGTRVWNAETGRELYRSYGHRGPVYPASFSPTGRRIISASSDNTARVWQRVRPEWWWGVFWLPQFWFTVLFAVGFVWSLRRDYQQLMRVQPA